MHPERPASQSRQRRVGLDAARMVPGQRASRGGHPLSLLPGQRRLASPAVVDAMNVGLPSPQTTARRRSPTQPGSARAVDAMRIPAPPRPAHVPQRCVAPKLYSRMILSKGKVMRAGLDSPNVRLFLYLKGHKCGALSTAGNAPTRRESALETRGRGTLQASKAASSKVPLRS